ncbi:M3 family metallopeptidase [Williamsia sterculiae]|uniref:Peptidyl-dipeptidase Dcp n=1 Tax=Williamsia sterculiae TaxID=1344003 RepID=A0A1N7G5Z0_9NOCA|nr:M3 family metallopeptidase [Williamsia sterculiae]SIS08009.1 peptidyl-dipeptidase Dcp [Williamsia sterculiae]
MTDSSTVNPVLAPSGLIHDLPDFASIADSDFLPAFAEAMAEQLLEVGEISSLRTPPTFANTVEALERTGQSLARAAGIFFNLSGPDTNPERKAIAEELATRLSEHRNAIALDPDLFRRIETLYVRRDDLGLDEPARRLLEHRYREAVRAGAALDGAGQARMRRIAARLAVSETQFSQRVLDGGNSAAVLVDTVEELDGMSHTAIDAARRAAAAAGHDSGWLLTLDLPTSQSASTVLSDPNTRARVFDASVGRCGDGDHDTTALVLEIVRLRAERAELLGYANHAELVIAEQTAPGLSAVDDLLADLTTASMRAGGRELTRLRDFAGEYIGPADMTYWLERERTTTAAVDLGGFADYCELNRVLVDGVFHAAGQLYGLRFVERPDLPTYHPDVRSWEVFDARGKSIGLFLGDFFARPSKRGGAWMNNVVDQSILLNNHPVVVNVLNITKPDAGQPCLLSMYQLNTLFHEFGHALHGLLSLVRYPSQSGTSVPRDFVEFPSQVNEMWALHPDVLQNYARHHETGEPVPADVAEAARASMGVESAHATIEYLGAALLDLAWHRLGAAEAAAVDDIDAFEASALQRAGIASELIPPRYKTRYFNHIFGGGYSAGYYSYVWSEVLDAETEQWFLARGGLRIENGRTFARATLIRGDSVDPIAAHTEMVGHPADVEPLLRRKGLVPI